MFIFRLAGIYGPNRNALNTLLRNPNVLRQTSETIDMLVSRVHVDDLAAAVASAILSTPTELDLKAPRYEHVYNISDDLPASRKDVFKYADALLNKIGLACQAKAVQTQYVSRRHKQRASKRVSNAKMKELLPELKYPSYREGLKAIAIDMQKI